MRVLLFLLLFSSFYGIAQTPKYLVRPGDTLSKDAFINTVEQSFNLFLAEYANQTNYDSLIKALNFDGDVTPEFSDEVYCERLEKLNDMSPFHLDCNSITLTTIKYFAKNRRGFAKIVLGRSALYFDLFEEKLAEYGLPIELKFLSVIESGLRPQVKSKAGALGLWQFMYKTGLYFGLKENSYIDERMDPVLATDAACRYLKQLYGIYGDWNLALAAYNAGPGNVNKAIRRSGNKTTYWDVRPYLPTETQGYVPNFIAATYLLSYHVEHNIVPVKAKVHYAQLDTMCLNSGVHMSTIAKLIDWPEDDIKTLNPVYKTNYIPTTKPPQCITGPLEKIGLLVSLEDTLNYLEKKTFNPSALQSKPETTTTDALKVTVTDTLAANTTAENQSDSLTGTAVYHKVKSGETLTSIADKYSVTSELLMEWNGLQTTNVYVGQRLLLKETNVVEKPKPEEKKETEKKKVTKKYYTVKKGDTFSRIADKHHLSQSELKKLNPGVSTRVLRVGQRIRVK